MPTINSTPVYLVVYRNANNSPVYSTTAAPAARQSMTDFRASLRAAAAGIPLATSDDDDSRITHYTMHAYFGAENDAFLPSCLEWASLQIAATCARTIARHAAAGSTLARMDGELRQAMARVPSIPADPCRVQDVLTGYVREHVQTDDGEQVDMSRFETGRAASQDTRELFSAVSLAVNTAVFSAPASARGNSGLVLDVYAAGYAAANAHIYGERKHDTRCISVEFVTDGGGNLVSINAALASLIHGGDKYTPAHSGIMTDEEAMELGDALHAAFATLRPAQRDVVEMIARGYSVERTAEKLNRSVSTVYANLAISRAAVVDYFAAHAPALLRFIKAAEVKAEAANKAVWGRKEKQSAEERRTEEGKARHDAQAAERMRLYRAAIREHDRVVDCCAVITEAMSVSPLPLSLANGVQYARVLTAERELMQAVKNGAVSADVAADMLGQMINGVARVALYRDRKKAATAERKAREAAIKAQEAAEQTARQTAITDSMTAYTAPEAIKAREAAWATQAAIDAGLNAQGAHASAQVGASDLRRMWNKAHGVRE